MSPGLVMAGTAVREGDTLVVPKLDRLARSVPDARAIGDDLAGRIKLSLGGQVYDPADPMGKMFFNILATFAEFEVDLLRMRTREGMAVARAKGKLRGKQPKLSARQQRELVRMAGTGEFTIADLAEVFTVSRDDRVPHPPTQPARPATPGWSHCTLHGQAAYDACADVTAGIDAARLPFLINHVRPALGPVRVARNEGEDQG
jgi:hypothetical protein